MKAFILILFLSIASIGAEIDKFAQELNYSRDYNSSIKIAKKENKILMLLVVADYCPWCKKFERKTLENSSVAKIVSNEFIPVVIDNKRDKGRYPEEFNTPLIPTVFFINPHSEKSIYHSVAYKKVKEFKLEMRNALNAFKMD